MALPPIPMSDATTPIDPEALRPQYSAFLEGGTASRILLTGHSHQAWPDVAREGMLHAFEDAARHVDDKWGAAMKAADAVRTRVADWFGGAPEDVALAQNSHELLFRFLSALDWTKRRHFFDDESGHVGVVSIPRDLLVEIPDHGAARINATLRIAVRAGDDPLEVMRGVVSEVLDAPIDHVLVGDLEAFERSVDGLGGIEVDVPCSIRDRFHDPRAEGGRRMLDVEAGQRRMDGVTAAMYVRSRHGRSDWDRARRQQAVLAGLRRRLREVGPTGWLPVVGQALEAGVYTTMSRLELLGLARRVSRVAPERMHGLLIGTKETDPARTADGRYVLEPDYAAIDEALVGLFDAPSPGLRPERKRCPDPDVALRHRAPSRDDE